MTREEAFKKLEVTVGVYLVSGNADNTYCREWREILETLKQESKANVLDKIRTEIGQNAYPIVHGVNNYELGMTLYGILQIIDKYKGSEE